jgi:hypothetical protein
MLNVYSFHSITESVCLSNASAAAFVTFNLLSKFATVFHVIRVLAPLFV